MDDHAAVYRSLCTQMYDLLCWFEREEYHTDNPDDREEFLRHWYQVKATYETYEFEPKGSSAAGPRT